MKIGFDQLDKPAPLIYRRFINMLIMFVVPATVTFLSIFSSNEHTNLIITQTGLYTIGILKGLEYFLGNNNPETAVLEAKAGEPK